jgi:DnaJ domain
LTALVVYFCAYVASFVVFLVIGSFAWSIAADFLSVPSTEAQQLFSGAMGGGILITLACLADVPPVIMRRLELAGRSSRLLEEEIRKREAKVPSLKQKALSVRLSTALRQLGLDETATAHDIRRSYRAIIKECHPDQNGGSRSKERRLNAARLAYKLLCAAGMA